ncbi:MULTISPECIES: type II toxin-antitoxin system RelE/ParE family toxin [Vibrio]|uniref:type II toxin-antitoxin system RelE/ParE family toxin n=1 Tax=Vibrio TaxID=662 RepID=UPI0020763BD4|nr:MULTISPECIES: type II toxin-antitoxin system RelE/ParE family toxin [Vibrio]USD32040.1 type II toxin-antitoxin system RelE/ParE family toxin [Vibrio sp. SCSIO 43186]USD45081.1 type II toxin-antitoxin system RelE/ParE family toxin [Vibrio sp. SCSIO 43145]USD69163.1 type II toxin-antitoxin system RelE/ParE family toxin [Vibrio sp. SCSIO 43139]USD96853.1 addiction module toxin RelE [Vibrio coralliilyticus]
MSLAKVSKVEQTRSFQKTVKKLHANQKKDLDKAVKEVIEKPDIGERKKGDLSFLRVHKFKMAKQLTLLGYKYDEDGTLTLTLMALGSHENFYRDLK